MTTKRKRKPRKIGLARLKKGDYFDTNPLVRFSRLEGTIATRASTLERMMSKLEENLVGRLVASDELMCKATEVLKQLTTNMAGAKDHTRELDAHLTLRIESLGELLTNRGRFTAADLLAVVDAARGLAAAGG